MGTPPQVSFIPEKPTKQCPHSSSATHSPTSSTPTAFCPTTQRTAMARSLRNATPAPTHRRNRADIIEHQAHNRTPDPTPRRDKLTWQKVPGHWQALGAPPHPCNHTDTPHHCHCNDNPAPHLSAPPKKKRHKGQQTEIQGNLNNPKMDEKPAPDNPQDPNPNPSPDPDQKAHSISRNLTIRGATREIGSALTRMCMRHRSIEAKLRHFTNVLMEGLVTPLQDRIEEWKKTANQLDKDHTKEYKRARQEIKRKSLDTIKLQKKARKGRGNLRPQLDSAMQDVSDLYLLMEETEKQAVRRALLEERGRYCTFINFLQPVVNVEIAMLGEITHLQAIVDDLTALTEDPHKLPPASEQVIRDLKGSDYSWSYQTPPSSPSSTSSRKSSMCSLLQMPSTGAHRLSSVSSHDSGFVSQDANTHSKPPSPMPSDITSQKSTSSASSEASETCQSVSECNSPTADWAKSSSCEPALAGTPERRRDSVEKMRELDAPPSPQGYSGMQPGDPHRARSGPGIITAKHGEPLSPAASTLAMVLTRGLSMEQQKSSRDSLQYSSGYSTQTNTPSCSEDTIPSQ
ncbi:Protein MTSS 2, partial [Ilyodon furcidens]